MRKIILLLLLATACALNAVSQSGRRVTNPRPAPPPSPMESSEDPEPEARPVIRPAVLSFLPESFRERKIKGIDSGSFSLADFSGRVVVINLWASWCGPCRREVPEYERVRKAYADRAVEFIGLTTEDPRSSSDRVNQFLRDVRFGFRLGWADRETARTLMNGKSGIPQTMVIDGEGRIVDQWTGYAPGRSGDKLKQTIDHALEITQ